MDQEKWKKVGNYLVSTNGNIQNPKGKAVKGYIDHYGYRAVHLPERMIYVHQLVADAFIPGVGKVYHINEDRADNRLCNLERR